MQKVKVVERRHNRQVITKNNWDISANINETFTRTIENLCIMVNFQFTSEI